MPQQTFVCFAGHNFAHPHGGPCMLLIREIAARRSANPIVR